MGLNEFSPRELREGIGTRDDDGLTDEQRAELARIIRPAVQIDLSLTYPYLLGEDDEAIEGGHS